MKLHYWLVLGVLGVVACTEGEAPEPGPDESVSDGDAAGDGDGDQSDGSDASGGSGSTDSNGLGGMAGDGDGDASSGDGDMDSGGSDGGDGDGDMGSGGSEIGDGDGGMTSSGGTEGGSGGSGTGGETVIDTCGDGITNGDDECDNGDGAPGGGCTSDCTLTAAKIIFTTSETNDGNFGGLTGADSFCQRLASAAGLAGSYMAFLSDATGSPETRMTHASDAYVNVVGDLIAENWDDLTDGSISCNMRVDEYGDDAPNVSGLHGSAEVFTNIKKNNATIAFDSQDCNEWSSNSDEYYGATGSSFGTDYSWASYRYSEDCSRARPVYCVEQ